jgi:hypothetical protein
MHIQEIIADVQLFSQTSLQVSQVCQRATPAKKMKKNDRHSEKEKLMSTRHSCRGFLPEVFVPGTSRAVQTHFVPSWYKEKWKK